MTDVESIEKSLHVFIVVMSFVLGTAIGSGITCCIFRHKAGESWSHGRSHCDSCGHDLSLIDLIPVLGYLINRGKCRYCHSKIPLICLGAELAFGNLGIVLTLDIIGFYIPTFLKIILTIIAILTVGCVIRISKAN